MSDKVKEVASEEAAPKLNAGEVLAHIQSTIASNLTSGDEVRNVLCGLAADLMLNGFRSEHLEHRLAIGIKDGAALSAFVSINVETFQKVTISHETPEVERSE